MSLAKAFFRETVFIKTLQTKTSSPNILLKKYTAKLFLAT